MNKIFALLTCLFCAAALATTAGGAARFPVAGVYSLSGGVMNGEMVIRTTNAGYRAVIRLTSSADHVAHFEGAAVIDGDTVKIWSDDEGYGAELTLSFKGEDTMIITENEGASMYHGMNATFEGTYKYSLISISVSHTDT